MSIQVSDSKEFTPLKLLVSFICMDLGAFRCKIW